MTDTTATAAPMPTSNPFSDLGQWIEGEITAVGNDIKQFWNTEEPIVVGEIESWGKQLAGIAASELVSVLKAVASGAITSTEQFGQLVTNTYQTAIGTGLALTIADAQTAASQAVTAATTFVAGKTS